MISIIDYGVGNIKAFVNVYNKLDIPVQLVKQEQDLKKATKIILPGVGHFDYAMDRFLNSGLAEKVDHCVKNLKIPVLGICVGMQMMAKSSEEGKLPGLGWIDAEVKQFSESDITMKPHVPHMGWNTLHCKTSDGLLKGFKSDLEFYFLHSYYFVCHKEEEVIATCDYGINFAAIVNSENVYGIQCHPEKSHFNGINLLKNFALL